MLHLFHCDKAERVGLEPTYAFAPIGFQDRPLYHLSTSRYGGDEGIRTPAPNKRPNKVATCPLKPLGYISITVRGTHPHLPSMLRRYIPHFLHHLFLLWITENQNGQCLQALVRKESNQRCLLLELLFSME